MGDPKQFLSNGLALNNHLCKDPRTLLLQPIQRVQSISLLFASRSNLHPGQARHQVQRPMSNRPVQFLTSFRIWRSKRIQWRSSYLFNRGSNAKGLQIKELMMLKRGHMRRGQHLIWMAMGGFTEYSPKHADSLILPCSPQKRNMLTVDHASTKY